jgi:hypothetical protein
MIKASAWSALDHPKTFWRISLHPSLPDIGSIVKPISLFVDLFSRFQGLFPYGSPFETPHVIGLAALIPVHQGK